MQHSTFSSNMSRNKHVTIEFHSTIYSGVSTFGIGTGCDRSPLSMLVVVYLLVSCCNTHMTKLNLRDAYMEKNST